MLRLDSPSPRVPIRCSGATSVAPGSIPALKKISLEVSGLLCIMVKSISRSGNQSLAHSIQYVDKIARASHLAHQRDLREHVHLLDVDVVNSADLVVAAEFLPCRTCLRWFRR